MKRWLYMVQQRLAITNGEATALLTVSFLLALGLVVGEIRNRTAPFDDETYAASDRLFRQHAVAAGQGPASWRSRASVATDSSVINDRKAEVEPGSDGVGRKEESAAPAPPPVPEALTVDLNAATVDELQQLPRIGPKIAQRIVEFRERHGPFRATSEITAVRGIGDATFDRLRDYLRIGAPRQNSSSRRDTAATPGQEAAPP